MRLLFLSLCLFSGLLVAQPCDYDLLMRQGDVFYQHQKYRVALQKYNAARVCDRSQGAAVDAAISRLFDAIERQRDEAKNQKIRAETLLKTAETEKRKADSLLVTTDAQRIRAEQAIERADSLLVIAQRESMLAENARIRADSLLLITLDEKARADSALSMANRVLGQMHFYDDRLGLASKNIAGEGELPIYRYGYINREGIEKIPFLYENATHFDRYDGFARVSIDNDQYLLDTIGNRYLFGSSESEQNEAVVWVNGEKERNGNDGDVFGSIFWSILASSLLTGAILSNDDDLRPLLVIGAIAFGPVSFGYWKSTLTSKAQGSFTRSNGLKVVLITKIDRGIDKIRVRKLLRKLKTQKGLQHLSIIQSEYDKIPARLFKLDGLTKLDLSDNQIATIPTNIRLMKNLRELNLSFNQLNSLPEEIYQLEDLKYLDLRGNSFTNLEKEVIMQTLPHCQIIFPDKDDLNSRKNRGLAEEWDLQGRKKLSKKNVAKAENYIRAGIEADSTYRPLHATLPHILLLQGKKTEAMDMYNRLKDVSYGYAGYATFREAFLAGIEILKKNKLIRKKHQADVEEIKKLLTE